MKRNYIALIVLAGSLVCRPAAGAEVFPDHGQALREVTPNSTDAFVQALDTAFPRVMLDYGTTAAVAAVVKDGRVIAVRAWGEAQPGVPVDADSLFGVASMSKLVTAWGLMTLVDRGLIDLDKPASTYLTEPQKHALAFDTGAITVRQLLSHTAGLSGRSARDYWPGDIMGTTLDELSAKSSSGVPDVRIVRPPGSAWAYSGAGFGVLQLIAEDVSGKPFADFMQNSVFVPLKMTRTFYGNPELTDGRVTIHFDEAGHPIKRLGYANLAAAALYTTLNDFTKLVLADLDGGHGVLHAGDMSLMESPAPGSGGKYGFGYFIERLTDTEKVVGHDGSDVGWNSMYRAAPSRKAAFVIFTNNSMGLGAYFAPMCGWYRSLGSDRTDYCPPQAQLVVHTLYAQGQDAAVALNAQLASQYGDKYGFSRPYWNFVAYQMLRRGAKSDAVSMFRLIVALNPTSADAFDSLGEGYVAIGDIPNAIASYQKALELNPTLETAKAALKKLDAGRVPVRP